MKNWLDWVAMILTIIGALNLGILGILKINLIYNLFRNLGLTTAIYVLIGLAGLYMIYFAVKK
ncbi:MAG: DUF378 domain-containing protein [Nanoarchaeota archaeon]|nr:DUF378 domain-containing protein [Nanoarchaeota archaeon]